jgi:putative ABC transport system permease protein
MTLSEILRQAFATFRAHKMRTFLTMFGIVWGIASVIILVGLGRGFSVDQKKNMQIAGQGPGHRVGRAHQRAGRRAGGGTRDSLNVDDADLIRDECYLVKNVSPELRRTIPEVSQYNLANRGVVGMWPSYQDFRSLKVSEGRLITDDDEREGGACWCWDRKPTGSCFPDSPPSARACWCRAFPIWWSAF